MTREEWDKRLREQEKLLGFDMGYQFLFCPWDMLRKAEIAFLSLGPRARSRLCGLVYSFG